MNRVKTVFAAFREMNRLEKRLIPVSYTHLDVYKRQTLLYEILGKVVFLTRAENNICLTGNCGVID